MSSVLAVHNSVTAASASACSAFNLLGGETRSTRSDWLLFHQVMCFNQQVIYVIYHITQLQMLKCGSEGWVLDFAIHSNAFWHAFHLVIYSVIHSVVCVCQVGFSVLGCLGWFFFSLNMWFMGVSLQTVLKTFLPTSLCFANLYIRIIYNNVYY